MENRKINIFYYLIVIFFLAICFILIRDFNARRVNDYKEYVVSISNIIKQKNDKIRVLYSLLVSKSKENADLRNTLAETRNDLDSISKKLVQPAPAVAVVPAAAPVTAAK